jgi:hypothetical protein
MAEGHLGGDAGPVIRAIFAPDLVLSLLNLTKTP